VPAHCTWIPALGDLADALTQLNPEMLVCVSSDGTELPTVVAIRKLVAPEVPLVTIRTSITEELIAADIAAGARDAVCFANPARLQAVIDRELRNYRLERALNGTLRSVQDYRRQLETVLTRSNDAIVQIQEGILVEANASWLELMGVTDEATIVGQPIMDFFDEATHPALKGALIGCQQGRWNDHSLKVDALAADGRIVPLEVVLSVGQRDGEACVRIMVPAQKRGDERQLARDLQDAVRRHPRTGLMFRQAMIDALVARMATPVHGGGRFLVSIRPDGYAKIERDVGATASEEFLVTLAQVVHSQMNPQDILGHFGGASLLALIERGTDKDAEAWAERLMEKIGRTVFQVGAKSFRATVTMGLSVVSNTNPDLDGVIADAQEATRRGRQRGGNQLCTLDRSDADTRVQSYDAIWVKHIKAALMENRFRLVQQPIANLQGTDTQMFDVLVRMIDLQGKEVLPSEFMAAAERNDLLKNIDRWVIGAALNFAAKRKPGCLFVRLARGSALDPSLIPWLDAQLKATNVEPRRVCMQIAEEIASQYVQETGRLGRELRARGMRFALDHFGTGRDPIGLMNSLQLDFVKIDGSLMQGLADDEALQERVGKLVEAATKQGISTIAERVENANTMAVLWQLGVQHLQGHFIQTPEEVVMEAR
jgi:multidomain signaling protein FimX